jgi:hypothetical protein
MWNEIFQQGYDITIRFFDKGILFLSTIIGVFLSSIGYPKQVIAFVVGLTILDIITKQISQVIINYKLFTLRNYFKAWKDKFLTSRQLKNGICVKVILYGFVLYSAHQLSVIPEIYLGKEISGVLYTALCLIEISSVFENFDDSGAKGLKPFLNFFRDKQKQVLGDVEEKVKEGE